MRCRKKQQRERESEKKKEEIKKNPTHFKSNKIVIKPGVDPEEVRSYN